MSSHAEPGWEALARDPSSVRSLRAAGDSSRSGPRSTSGYLVAFLALLGYAKDFMADEVLGDLARALGRASASAR